MERNLDVTVQFSTYNRSKYLLETLEAMCQLDCDGLNVEFVVVDNNSSDDTGEVIDSFANRLPLRHLFEPRPGKSCALNHALDTVELAEIVVFTDDDVAPRKDWLQQIAAACERWPEYEVFGGKVELIWPDGVEIPRWATENDRIRRIGFVEYDLGTQPKPYERNRCPVGGNFWVRRSVFSGGVRYDESIGPRPGRQFGMGEEMEFLLRLAADGRRALYVPSAVVGHHVQVSLLDPRNMLKRAIRSGRGKPHIAGVPDPEQLTWNPWRWRMRRLAGIVRNLLWRLRAQLQRDECIRMRKAFEALRNYAYHREALAMSWGTARATKLGETDDGQPQGRMQGSKPKSPER
jgi:glycosyltransferase involved in cell wall biosynthesis